MIYFQFMNINDKMNEIKKMNEIFEIKKKINYFIKSESESNLSCCKQTENMKLIEIEE